MKWRSYPAYKDSGIDWMGRIPEHWGLKRLKHVTRCLDGRRVPLNAEQRGDMKGDFPYWGANGIVDYVDSWIFDEELVLLGEDGAPFFEPFKDVSFFVSGKIWVNNHAHVLRPLIGTNPHYLKHLLNSVHYRSFIDGTTRDKLTQSDMNDIPTQFPPLDEQIAIRAFLDRESERIDSLIVKKQRQIELLHEKRTALISHAVTKGLKPNIKMKYSGIEWLGEIPEDWEVKRIKYIGSIKYGLGEPPEKLEGGVPFIRATDINRGKIDPEKVQTVAPDDIPWSRDPMLRANDILVVRSGAYTGDSAIVPSEWDGAIAGYDMVLRVKYAMSSFIAYVLLSDYMLIGQIYVERSRAAQPHLNAEELGSFIVLIPPEKEQEEIVKYLDIQTMLIDVMIEKVIKSLALLNEYRTALISAAVTGKIDVRQEVA